MIRLLKITFLLSLISLSAFAQEKIKFSVSTTEQEELVLSGLVDNSRVIRLKNPKEKQLHRVSDILVAPDRLFILDSNNPDHSFPKRLSVFNSNGDLIKTVGGCFHFAYDALNEDLFGVYGDTIRRYDKNGEIKEKIFLKGGMSSFYLFEGALYFNRHKYQSEKTKKYSVYEINRFSLSDNKVERLHEFKIFPPSNLGSAGGSISAVGYFFSYDGKLYNAYGFPGGFHQISPDGTVNKVAFKVKSRKLSYFDQIMARFGVVGETIYFSHRAKGHQSMFLKNLKEDTESLHKNFVVDDLYQTKGGWFRGSRTSNYYYMVHYADQLSDDLKKTHQVDENDILIILGR